jgi:hypothetical protein
MALFIVHCSSLIVHLSLWSRSSPAMTNEQSTMNVEGQWQPRRWLNGDQTHQGRHLRLPSGKFDIQRVKLYRYR